MTCTRTNAMKYFHARRKTVMRITFSGFASSIYTYRFCNFTPWKALGDTEEILFPESLLERQGSSCQGIVAASLVV